eukprot:CAMPEP_0206510232 /NCGR_PEP_ID=MMETSP0324_2-20121206/59508_1 /ASSEMBLY_ACC=CAM_ASM_000836 /TAXON_ID=2866 /ORGANISM="Crypthecodinium cohnii, Strain Seligo" /LENGTH=48 /DNA_ID= /DNA_START= /DNA_END= /DNA_ORIENTATION=
MTSPTTTRWAGATIGTLVQTNPGGKTQFLIPRGSRGTAPLAAAAAAAA